MKIRYMLSYPMNLDHGGGSNFAAGVVENIKRRKIFIEQLDWRNELIDFDVLFVFGFTFINYEILLGYKSKGIKILLFPIFDRIQPKFLYQAKIVISKLLKTKGFESIRKFNLNLADYIVVSNQSEKEDLLDIYKIIRENIFVYNLGLPDDIFKLSEQVTQNLFFTKYQIKDFVVFPSAKISKRKNQIQLLKALKGTVVPIVLTGSEEIENSIKLEFLKLVGENKNVLCLPRLSREMLVSCLKCASVCVSLSSSETAGLSNLEAGYLGCNLVVSNIPPFREYLKDWPSFVNSDNLTEIRDAIQNALNKPYDEGIRKYIIDNFTWEKYCDNILVLI